MIQPLIPKVLAVAKKIVTLDDSKAILLMEIWEELLETEVSMLAPHLKSVTDLCLEIATNKDFEDAIRIKALSFVGTLARLKKKVSSNVICSKHYINFFLVSMASP